MTFKFNEQGYKSLILLLIPLSIFVSADGIFSVQSIILEIALLVIYDICTQKIRFSKHEGYVFATFLLVSVAALMQNLIFSPNLITTLSFIRIAYFAAIIYLYYSLTGKRYTVEQINNVISVCIFTGVLVSLYLIFIEQIWFRSLLGVQVDKNFVGAMLALQAELAFIRVLNLLKIKRKLLYAICYLIMIIGIFYTASRASVLVVILGTFIAVLAKIKKLSSSKKQFAKTLFLIIGIPIIVIIVIGFLQNRIASASVSIQWYWNRYFINGFGDESVTGRWVWWKEGIFMWSERPIWGYGIGNVNISGNSSAVSHNTYIDFLIDQGILGFMGFLYIIYRSIKQIIKKKIFMYYGILVTVLLTTFVLSATRSTFLWFSLILLYCLGNTELER